MATRPRYYIRITCQHFFQLLVMFLCKLFLLPITQRDISVIKVASVHKPYIIIANHKRALDPFIIMAALPYNFVRHVLPVSFMTYNGFYDSLLKPLLWLSGSFPARNPHGKHAIFGVEGAATLLKQGSSVFIFPEGTRVRDMPRGPAKSGVVRLHSASPNSPFLLCHITYKNGFRAWATGQRFTVTYKTIQHPSFTDPEKIMNEVFAL